ncbi:MAG: glycosyltransferase family 4 protein [Candidatus Nomurabacteria bacterium]|nr:MAG: glycosyltransferase family 4 protein [Candidatus Nomurabacteria bacterium]
MKIAMMVRAFLETPPPGNVAYSPAIIAQTLAEGLQQRGHTVTFFGPEGTKLDVDTIETYGMHSVAKDQAELDDFVGTTELFSDYRPALYDASFVKKILERAASGEFDCVLFHHFESALPIAGLFPKVPVVYIVHDFIDSDRREAIEMHSTPNQHFISISDSQRRDAPDINYAATVYNGIDTDLFTTDGEPEDYLMISGRVTPDKGVKEAVQIAMQTDRKLLISGSVSKSDQWYFDEHVKPYLSNKILFLGMLERAQLVKYYQNSGGLLMPIQWQEPFGLAMVEAGACGTPVIAFNRGSVQEVVKDEKTGFIVNNSAEMILAIEKLPTIKRKDCRDHVVKNFSLTTMIDGYEEVLTRIVSENAKPKKPQPDQGTPARISQKVIRISKRLLNS